MLRAHAGAIDVVLLDVVMPELDGYETLGAIKADEAIRHLPVIMISGVDELDSVVRCIELGATDYLPKPFNPRILAARIGASLTAKRLHDLEVESMERQRRAARDDRASEARADPIPVAAGRRARLDRRRASSCSPATDARSPSSSATCAASPRSATRRSPKSCSACCASTTAMMGEADRPSTGARSSTSPATG